MIILEPNEYIETRLDDQINWYDAKSSFNKNRYYFWQTVSLISAALVPLITVISGLLQVQFRPILTAICGTISVICQSILSIFQYHDIWTEYRRTTELLRKEKYMYQTSTGLYRQAELPFKDLVERTETIISNENINWTNLTSNKKSDGE